MTVGSVLRRKAVEGKEEETLKGVLLYSLMLCCNEVNELCIQSCLTTTQTIVFHSLSPPLSDYTAL